jgi:hypothetical protein
MTRAKGAGSLLCLVDGVLLHLSAPGSRPPPYGAVKGTRNATCRILALRVLTGASAHRKHSRRDTKLEWMYHV